MYDLLMHWDAKTADCAQEWYLRGGDLGPALPQIDDERPPQPPPPVSEAWLTKARIWADSTGDLDLRTRRHAAIDRRVSHRGGGAAQQSP